MRSVFSEKKLVVIMFVAVLVTFALAQEESRKLEAIYPLNTSLPVPQVHPAGMETADNQAAPVISLAPAE